MIFYRPTRGRHSSLAIWTSHREVAREALRRGQQRVLVLEDDLRFLRGWAPILGCNSADDTETPQRMVQLSISDIRRCRDISSVGE